MKGGRKEEENTTVYTLELEREKEKAHSIAALQKSFKDCVKPDTYTRTEPHFLLF